MALCYCNSLNETPNDYKNVRKTAHRTLFRYNIASKCGIYGYVSIGRCRFFQVGPRHICQSRISLQALVGASYISEQMGERNRHDVDKDRMRDLRCFCNLLSCPFYLFIPNLASPYIIPNPPRTQLHSSIGSSFLMQGGTAFNLAEMGRIGRGDPVNIFRRN